MSQSPCRDDLVHCPAAAFATVGGSLSRLTIGCRPGYGGLALHAGIAEPALPNAPLWAQCEANTTTPVMSMRHLPISDFSISSELLIESVVFDAPKCLVHTNFLQLNKELGWHHLRDVYVANQQRIPEIRLHRLPPGVNLAVQTDEDFISYIGENVLGEQIRPHWTENDIAFAIANTAGLVDVSEEAVLVARYGIRTWGHWLGELLPKVVCVENAYPGRFRYVIPESIITDINLRTVRQSLNAYGIGRERLVFVRGGRRYRFTNLFAVSPIWFPLRALHPRVAGLMRSIIPQHDQLIDIPKNVALLRRENTTRNISNALQVYAYLQSRDWSIIDVARLDFMDQVRVFAGTENIISVLGSGLSGLIYSREGIRLVTLAPSHWGDLFFFSLMQERRVRLVDLRGVSTAKDTSQAARMPFLLEIADLGAGLRALDLPNEPLAPELPAGGSPGVSRKPATVRDMLDEALELRDADQLFEAEERARQAIQCAPDEVAAYIYLVEVLMRQGKIEAAITTAELGLAVYPSWQMLRLMQDHLTSFERYGEAVEYARRDAALDAGDAESLSRLGHALCKVGQFDEAAASFARALELSMHDLGLHVALVNALACAGRLDDAISAMHTTIARFPQDPGARVRLGEMLALQNQTEAAGNALNDALALDPANADAARSLANLRGTPRMTLWSQFLTHRGNAMSKWKQYFPAYQRHLSKFTDQSILLIEIGVSGGGSLQLWKQFLGPFVRIVGIDANEICQQFEEDQISVRIGGQSDCGFLQSIINEFGRPDVVIDDGSHNSEDQITSFQFLYPLLSNNGVYAIEDLHAAFWAKQEGSNEPLGNTMDLCKSLIDELHGRYMKPRRTTFTDTTRSISFYDSLVVFERGIVQNLHAPATGAGVAVAGLVIDDRGLRELEPGESVPQDT